LKRVAPDESSTGRVRVERILGHPVHPVSKAQAVEAVVRRAGGQPGAYVCLTNAHTTVESQRSPALRAAVEDAYLSVPDGMPLAWIMRRRGHRHTEKVTGIEYIPMVARRGVDLGLRHFFYGGAQGVADRAGRSLERLVPGVRVVGSFSPPFAEPHRWAPDDLERDLLHTKPHILWVGLGAPKQELWMARMAGELGVPVMIGVGAAFDYLAGTKAAAPTLLRHSGFEWLFRLAVEPKRLWRRYLIGNTEFLWLVARERLVGMSPRHDRRSPPGRDGDGEGPR
jgi:N-acetylglucosaminyldiphosphoundecaprenol N-acetyl-beta-D-mannosaminyltransferase